VGVALGHSEAETIAVVDGDGAYNLKAKGERPKEEDLHNLEEEERNLLLMKLADNAVDGNETNWMNVDCEETEHGTSVDVAAVGHKLDLKVDGDD
jgi:hypothetical protein